MALTSVQITDLVFIIADVIVILILSMLLNCLTIVLDQIDTLVKQYSPKTSILIKITFQ